MIDITKPVRTKDGQRVEIFSDKGREPYPLIGYIGDSTALGTWTKDGMFFEQESSHHDIENYEPRPVRWNCLDPLPEPKPEEWAAEKAAFVEGRAIQFQPKGFNEWLDCVEPTWRSDLKYRIKPEPQWVPMEPDDIVVGMEFRLMRGGARRRWVRVKPHMVWFDDIAQSFEDLMRKGWQYRINGGEWKPCKKEVQV
jgi:hypothetical protein